MQQLLKQVQVQKIEKVALRTVLVSNPCRLWLCAARSSTKWLMKCPWSVRWLMPAPNHTGGTPRDMNQPPTYPAIYHRTVTCHGWFYMAGGHLL